MLWTERLVREPTANTLRLEAGPLPSGGAGQMLLRNQYQSSDPYMRGRAPPNTATACASARARSCGRYTVWLKVQSSNTSAVWFGILRSQPSFEPILLCSVMVWITRIGMLSPDACPIARMILVMFWPEIMKHTPRLRLAACGWPLHSCQP